MKKVFLALTLLVLASLACSLGNASPSAPPPAAASAPSTNTTVEPAPATPADSAPTAAPSAAPSAPSSVSPSAASCAHLYYPVKPGASWQYQLSGTSSGTFTRSIVSLNENGFEDQDVFSAGTTRRGSWACQQGSLISLTPSGGASVSVADEQATFVVESNSGVTLPADLQPGAAWTQNLVVHRSAQHRRHKRGLAHGHGPVVQSHRSRNGQRPGGRLRCATRGLLHPLRGVFLWHHRFHQRYLLRLVRAGGWRHQVEQFQRNGKLRICAALVFHSVR
jgi:hypothetical protein